MKKQFATHVVRLVKLPVGRIFQQQALKLENPANQALDLRRKILHLQIVDFVVTDDIFENCIKFIEDFDPRI